MDIAALRQKLAKFRYVLSSCNYVFGSLLYKSQLQLHETFKNSAFSA